MAVNYKIYQSTAKKRNKGSLLCTHRLSRDSRLEEAGRDYAGKLYGEVLGHPGSAHRVGRGDEERAAQLEAGEDYGLGHVPRELEIARLCGSE